MAPLMAAFVSGVDKRLPISPAADGPLERVMRLAFHIQEEETAVVPTLVTRNSGAAGKSVIIPQQVFAVVPMAHLLRPSPSLSAAQFSGSRACGGDAETVEPQRECVPSPSPRLDVAGVTLTGYAPGYKDRNQDSALLLDTFLSNRQQLLAVFDGHGPEGHRVSAFAKGNLPYTLLTQLVEEGDDGRHSRSSSGIGTGRAGAGEPCGWTAAPSMPAQAACDGGGAAEGCGGGPVPRALWRAVACLDQQLEESGIDVVNSGTTAALCHVHGRKLTAAWVGDSRMLLGLPAPPKGGGAATAGARERPQRGDPTPTSSSAQIDAKNAGNVAGLYDGSSGGHGIGNGGGWRVVWASTDHKPELPEEAQRIQAAGGRVARSVGREGPVGPYRVWFQDQAYPGLAMSRALGDLPGRHIGVTCTPSCASLRLPEAGPAVLVLASDGVWELLSNEQVLATAAGAGSAAEAACRLVQQSRRAWVKEYGGSYVDDITALVARFDMPPLQQRPQPSPLSS